MKPARYVVDLEDPRAPSQELWDTLTDEERAQILDSLPSEFPLSTVPEGDFHWGAKVRALEMLREFYGRTKRRIYLAAEMASYYPGQRVFAPDVMAVRDVELHPRMSWVVAKEGKGIDFALEIHAGGSFKKDFEDNVQRFAQLGIPEYFALDLPRKRLLGWRLPASGGSRYEPILPQGGRWSSAVLELDLLLEDGQLRFFHGSAPLLASRELVEHLTLLVDQAVRHAEDEARRAEDEARRAEEAARRAEEARGRADRLAAKLRAAGIDPDADE